MITPVLLCGGSGTRLWPLSRKSYPKQFAALTGPTTLFQASAQRLSGPDYAAPMVITGSDFRFIVTEQLAAIGVDPGAILIEPEGRNTAPAVLAAALQLEQGDPDGMMLVAPSDHVVPDPEAFRRAVLAGLPAARAGRLVTFGILPTHPETGYGYLELAEPMGDPAALQPLALRRFVEKPDAGRAAEMLAAGNFLWNAGIFLFSVRSILEAFRRHAPALIEPVSRAVREGKADLGFLRLAPAPWAQAKDISIDYAVMERLSGGESGSDTGLYVLPGDFGWSDLGTWGSLYARLNKDEAENAVVGDCVTMIESSGCIVRAPQGKKMVLQGMDDFIIAEDNDTLLICKKNQEQRIKEFSEKSN